MKKILIATGIYPPDIGGPATYVARLEKELRTRGFVVRVLAYTHLRHLPKGIRHLVYFFKLLLLALGCDIIYAQNSISAGFPAAIAATLFNKKLVLKVVGDADWEQARNKGETDLAR